MQLSHPYVHKITTSPHFNLLLNSPEEWEVSYCAKTMRQKVAGSLVVEVFAVFLCLG